jgi:Cu(I)/Ag(I) efflux system membrane fusion protein
MYATVEFRPVTARNAVVVPSLAVLRTGERALVVVALGGGRFAPREIRLGSEGRGAVQVLDGLREGEEVVTSAQFLIDSESNLREAIQKIIDAKKTTKK